MRGGICCILARGCCRRRGGLSSVGDVESLRVVEEKISRIARQLERWMSRVQVNGVGTTAANTEGRSFIHIHPDAVKGYVLMIPYQLICPEIHRLGVVKVGEDRIARPNRANIRATIRIFEPDVKLGTTAIWLVSD